MSEEEIIRNVKRIIEYKVISNYINDNDSRAIQGLLDLYNKEKEKNKNIEDIFVADNLPKEQVAIIISKQYFSEYKELKSNYISKDKIKNLIKSLEKQQEENRKELDKGIKYLSDNMVEAAKNKIAINMSIREYLEELLKERN